VHLSPSHPPLLSPHLSLSLSLSLSLYICRFGRHYNCVPPYSTGVVRRRMLAYFRDSEEDYTYI
jgi:hypothetical protein